MTTVINMPQICNNLVRKIYNFRCIKFMPTTVTSRNMGNHHKIIFCLRYTI